MAKANKDKQADWYARQKNPNGVIYRITHMPSGAFYVGSTTNSPRKRLQQHKAASKDVNKDQLLYMHMREHDLGDYYVEVLHTCSADDFLHDVESSFIYELQPDLNSSYGN